MNKSAYQHAIFAVIAWSLCGCAPLKQYRGTDLPPQVERKIALEGPVIDHRFDYLLGFIEFDDHGWFWDPRQMDKVMQQLEQEEQEQGLIMVAFAHGWKHNASTNDTNIKDFRTILKEMQRVEREDAVRAGRPARKVVGVYLGWRGLSQNVWLAKNLTFWERKNTAHMVGQGAVGEILISMDRLRKQSRIAHQGAEDQRRRSPTMLIVVGHSFGGAVVYSAVAPFLEERMLNTLDEEGKPRAPRGFGDLVVLINPAFEAARLEVLKRTSDTLTYATNQSATLAIFTSKADCATRTAFPVGRFFSTLFEKNRGDQPQYLTNIKAVGHYEPFTTHDLRPARSAPKPSAVNVEQQPASKFELTPEEVDEAASRIQTARNQVRKGRANPKVKEETIRLGTCNLDPREGRHVANSPVYIVSVSKEIIPDHSQFERRKFTQFLQEFILAFAANPVTANGSSAAAAE